MNTHGRTGICSLFLVMALQGFISESWATDRRNSQLSHDMAGYQPPDVDRAGRGAELLAAGPDSQLAFYNAPEHRIVLLQDLAVTNHYSVHGATDLAFTPAGNVLVLEDPTRSLSLWSPAGRLLAAADLPDLVPLGGRIEQVGSQIYIRDLFGSLHRAATLEGERLGAPQGELLIPQNLGLEWDASRRVLWVEGRPWSLPEALQASAQRIGSRWILVDEVLSESPLEVRRTAHDLKTGLAESLPVQNRLYTPRRDVTEGASGQLLYLWPRPEGLEIVEVQP